MDTLPFEEFRINVDEPIFTSGVVCRLLAIPMWVLKELDKEKIVSPPRRRGCSRLYSKRDLKTLEHVWFYIRERQINIRAVKVILEIEGRDRGQAEG